MALTDGGVQATMPVMPTGMGNYGGGYSGFGGDGWWILLLILFAGGGWGNGGWGGNGNMPGYTQVNDFSQLERENDIIREQICNQFANVNQTLANGFQTIQTSFANAELSRSNTQAAIMGQMYNMSMADLERGCNTQAAISNGFAQTNFNLAQQGCDTRNTIQNTTRDIIDSQNAGTRAVLDALTAQRIEDKNAQIADLTMRLNNATLMSSQAMQTSQLQNYVSGQFAYYNPRPVPAWVVTPPYTAPTTDGAARAASAAS